MKSTWVLAQTEQCGDPAINLTRAQAAVAEAVSAYRPDVMVFPERFSSLYPNGTADAVSLAAAQELDGPFVTGMRELAKANRLWMIFGFTRKTEADDGRIYNCTVVLNAAGEIVGTYHKTHLYDAFRYRESDLVKAGDRLFAPIDTPFGRIGLFVCYEVRFPEVARCQTLQGSEIIVMPTAWMKGDLKSHHFRTLITARAIENTVYMVACDQVGADTIGESVVVDPMGVPIAAAGEVPTLLCAHIDTDRVAAVREKLPSCKDRRPELYTD